MKLSKHFTLEEFTRSDVAVRKGIDNVPSSIQIENLRCLCENILEPMRVLVGRKVRITSGYRCPDLNREIGGSKTSQHMKGEAADLVVEGLTPQEIFSLVSTSRIEFDQLILEFNSWIHVSTSKTPRREKLVAVKGKNNQTIYRRL